MVSHHRKKIVTRTLDLLTKTGVKTEGSRIGKNYFLKYLLENPDMRRELAERTQPWQGTLSAPVNNQTSDNSVKTAVQEPAVQGPAFEETYVEMMVVLLSQLYALFDSNKQAEKAAASFLLQDIAARYKSFFPKQSHSLKTYEAVKEVLAKLRSDKSLVGGLKFFDQLHLQRLVSFMSEMHKAEGDDDSKKKKKKNQTQTRVSRLVYIWKLVKERKSVSMIDISNMIGSDLEKNLPFKIDKKTIVRLIDDLETLGVVTKKVFRIKIESQKIINDVTQFNRIMVADSFVPIDDEQLRQDPCISNPTFKRYQQLPTSLDFLATNGQKPKLLVDQKPRLLADLHERALKQSEREPLPEKTTTQAQALLIVLASMDLRHMRESMTKMRSLVGLFNISKTCESGIPRPSVTETFFQNKLELTTDINYIVDMLCVAADDSAKTAKKPSMLDFEATSSAKTKHGSTIDMFYATEDRLYGDLEARELEDCSDYASLVGHANVEDMKLEDCPSSENLIGLPKNSLLKISVYEKEKSAPLDTSVARRRAEPLDESSLKELASLKQPDVIYQRLVQQLKKGHFTTREELVAKLKHKTVVEFMIDQMLLQGDIEEATFVDCEGHKTAYLRSC